MMFVDGSSVVKGSGVVLLLENDHDVRIKVTIIFEFSIINNQEEYKACLDSLRMAFEMGLKEVTIKYHS